MNELLTPEIIGSLKTLAGFAGLDIATGVLSNRVVGRASLILKVAKTCLSAVSELSTGLSDLIQRIQDYGTEKTN